MASTSSSLVQKRFKYDVFLSFHGEDTRRGFVDHLYHALQGKGIITYKDDENIQKGERISKQLIRSIKDSRFYIVVFSKNYASSSWCLDELVEIIECQKTEEQTAYPVFYDVEPTQVRNQSGPVGEAFANLVAKHMEKEAVWRWRDSLKEAFAKVVGKGKRKRTLEDADVVEKDAVGRWRDALKQAANLAGWELKNTLDGHEAKFIQQFVQQISIRLHFVNSSIDAKLVGMETRVKNIVSSLETGSNDVRMIGIKGIGGGGKTTLARAVFDLMSVWFEGKSFVENVREVSKVSGLKELQKQVLKDVLNTQNIDVTSVSDGKDKMKKMMPSRKVLVVLDDVDDIDQLEALACELSWFKSESRIIITTRDEQVLLAHSVNFIHDVNLLSHEEAICLFSRYAFKTEIPNQGYEDLSRKVVHYAAGLPLTIKVLGSHLCRRSKPQWVDAIERLKNIPLKETLEKLELSYNGLENDQKEIFLDVVCVLKGEEKDRAIRILESCGYNARIGLRVLEQKSLITISDSNGCLGFHDHIEEMGRNIVRRLHPNEASRHSRLWIKEEIKDILVNELGTKATRSIQLDYVHVNPTTIMKGLRKLKELRLLIRKENLFQYLLSEDDEVNQYLPDTLQSLCWYNYPFRSLPENFLANNLVNLEMRWSDIRELWNRGERKVLNKLRFVDLRYSKLRTFNLRATPHLEVLDLEGCKHLVELQSPVKCLNLKVLNLSGSKVINLNLGMIPHLEKLNLERCRDFEELQFPVECLDLKVLNLSRSKVINLNLGMVLHLEELNLEGCSDFEELHMSVECPSLRVLNLSHSKVSNINLGLAPHLERLYLLGCSNLRELHAPVGCLEKLVYFRLTSCLNYANFVVNKEHELANPKYVATFNINVDYVVVCPVHPKNNFPRFKFECRYDEPRSSWSGNIEKLISFGPCVCENLEYILATICDLQHLRELTLRGRIPQDLWWLQSLEKLYLYDQQFPHLPDSICKLKHLKSLQLWFCSPLVQLPENICELGCLEELLIVRCDLLRDIPNSICKMKCLKCLELSYCHNIMKLPEELGRLECLKELRMYGTGISGLPQSIYQLKGLCIYGSREQLQSNGFTSIEGMYFWSKTCIQ